MIMRYTFLIQRLCVPITKFKLGNLIFILTVMYLCSGVFCTFSSYEKNGRVCYYCPRGFYWIADCLITGTQAQCMPCEANHYQTSQNIAHYCGKCTRCDEVVKNYNAAAKLVPCTPWSNTVCGCKSHHHFIKDYGGMGMGYCQENSKCAPGSGALQAASNSSNSDTVCEPCIPGSTYNPSPTYEPCLACTTACPNGSLVKGQCNTTRNLECYPNVDLSKPSNESIYPPNKHTPVLEIALGTIIPVIAILVVVFIVCICKRCRSGRSREPSVGYINGEVNLNQRPEAPRDTPLWISNCKTDGNVVWMTIFTSCEKHIVIARWELFIRTLFALSDRAEAGETEIARIKEMYPREKLGERIYQAVKSWKEQCYSDNEEEMVQILCKAYREHA